MSDPTAQDRRLEEVFGELGPTEEALGRVESRVLTAYEAEQRSLAAEWLDVFRVRPLLSAGFTVAAGAGLAVATPLGTLLLILLR